MLGVRGSSLRIVQISTSSSGGAGIAASRLTDLLAKDGIDTKLITRDSPKEVNTWMSDFFPKSLGKLITSYHKQISVSGHDLVTPFSVRSISLREIGDFKPDIVHIHNWYNLLSISDLRTLGERYPLVFTLHDERLLTGGCHMTLDCNRFLTGCRECPAVSLNRSLIARKKGELTLVLQGVKRFGVISPSAWLFNQTVKSQIAGDVRPIKVIPNVTSPVSAPVKKHYESEPNSKLRILFVAADLSAYVKDFSLALESISDFVSNDLTDLDVELHVVGSNFPAKSVTQTGFKLHLHGYLSEAALSKLMLQVDALLITSRSENSPNIIAEAQTLGLLVIARDAGGIPELITEGETGFLVDSSVASIVDGIRRFVNHKDKQFLSDNAVLFSNQHWGHDRILAEHKSFYSQLLNIS
jgi:glycosyltransferase involved in cell wall biosynthesis